MTRYQNVLEDHRNGITLDTLREHGITAPFAAAPSTDRSQRYGLVNSVNIAEELFGLGYVLTQAMQQDVRGASQTIKDMRAGHTVHLLRFTQEAYMGTASPYVPEVAIVNDSMGMGSYKVFIAVFRTICGNGLFTMVRGTETRVRHTVNMVRDVVEATKTLAAQSLITATQVMQMEQITIAHDEALALAEQALTLRYPFDAEGQTHRPDWLQPTMVLSPRRCADREIEGTLGGAFQTAQENIERGQHVNGSRATNWSDHNTRGVNALQGRIDFNQRLYQFAETIRRIHTGESLEGLVEVPVVEG